MSIPQREFEPHWNTASSGDMRTHVRATQVSPIATSVQPSTSGRVTCKFHFNLHRLTSETLGEALVPLEFAMVQTTIPVSDWIEKQLDDVAQLGPNWDGCGAVAIQPATVNAMKRELTDLLRPPYIRGTIVPGADGSLQAEWHKAGVSLGLVIEGDGSLGCWFVSDDGDREEIGPRAREVFKAFALANLRP